MSPCELVIEESFTQVSVGKNNHVLRLHGFNAAQTLSISPSKSVSCNFAKRFRKNLSTFISRYHFVGLEAVQGEYSRG